MNIVINCPHCNQEMVIDDSGVGQNVPCPTCSKDFVIPQGRPEEEVMKEHAAKAATASTPAAPKPEEKKEEKKPQLSKEEAAALLPGARKGPSKNQSEEKPGIRMKCIQHHHCCDMGKDHFAETVEKTLEAIDPKDIINISPVAYSYKDSQGEMLQDFGVMVIYHHRGASKADAAK